MERYRDLDAAVDAILERTGPRVVLGLPLGIGTPVPLANALVDRVANDPELSLTILTALTLARPPSGDDLEGRLLGPILDRCFAGYPTPSFDALRRRDALPSNVEVIEFFLSPGSLLDNGGAQRSHASVNYTHVPRMVRARGINVIAQLVAREGERLSLSCNADITPSLLRAPERPLMVAQPHPELPFMHGAAELADHEVDVLVEHQAPFALPSIPDRPLGLEEHWIGLHAAGLVRDGGTIQLGIGELADAVTRALLLRHSSPRTYQDLVAVRPGAAHVARIGGFEPFERGLYAVTEMLVEGLLDLLDAGILRRRSAGKSAIDAAFFLGPRRLLTRLREMSDAGRRDIRMRPVSFVNDVYLDYDAKCADRRDARFFNNAMLATLGGAATSDGLSDGRVVSGVGGQYNFVAMAHALPGGRSALMLRSTRADGSGTLRSNIRSSYGHTTIPRHLRDLVVTEYGVADLRDRTDAEVYAAMIEVTDARFQDELVREARAAKKLPASYRVPDRARQNVPTALERALAPHRSRFDDFPRGADWTDVERDLARALALVREPTEGGVREALHALGDAARIPDGAAPYLARMGLDAPHGPRERLMARAVVFGLSHAGII